MDTNKYAPVGTKLCRSKCDTKVVATPTGPLVLCDGCNRIIIDKRK